MPYYPAQYAPHGRAESAFEYDAHGAYGPRNTAHISEVMQPVTMISSFGGHNPFQAVAGHRRRGFLSRSTNNMTLNAQIQGIPTVYLDPQTASDEEERAAQDPAPPYCIDQNLPYYLPYQRWYPAPANILSFVPETSRDAWLAGQNVKQPISNIILPGTTTRIGVEAKHYLQKLLDDSPTAEPLAPALGGAPLALEKHIEDSLVQWKSAGLQPFFVFDGLSTAGKEEKSLISAKDAINNTTEAWKLYAQGQPTNAVNAFRTTHATRAESFFRVLQNILYEKDLGFLVAPFGACAQLAHLYNHEEQYIDGIMGSYDLLFYNVDNIMTELNFTDQTFSFISKNTILGELRVSPDMFTDALLLLGTDSLPTFPPLPRQLPARPTVRDAINTIRVAGPAINTVTEHYADLLQTQDPNWLDKYQRARMAIKHHPVQDRGTFIVQDYDTLTGDSHEYIGLRIPDELMYYLTRGVISPRILNQIVSLECIVQPPLDGGETEEYRQLVSKQLLPVKQQVVALITSRIHRVFTYKNVKMRFWFDDSSVDINHRDIQPVADKVIKAWKVKEPIYTSQAERTGASPGSLRFALKALQDEKFAASTMEKSSTRLVTKEEIISNSWWLFLHLRGYVNDEHQLTSWGAALAKTVEALDPSHHLEEAAVLAFELLKYDQLNVKYPHEEYVGSPIRGSDVDKRCNLLISRVACLVKARQQPIGYVGPLSRNHLAFSSIIKAVRESDRDLIETVLVSLLMLSHAERSHGSQARPDLTELGLSLPFWKDVDCSMGVAVKTFLDDHCPPGLSQVEKAIAKKDYTEKNGFLPHAIDFAGDLDISFGLFDAIYTGVKALGDDFKDQETWDDANEYLTKRR